MSTATSPIRAVGRTHRGPSSPTIRGSDARETRVSAARFAPPVAAGASSDRTVTTCAVVISVRASSEGRARSSLVAEGAAANFAFAIGTLAWVLTQFLDEVETWRFAGFTDRQMFMISISSGQPGRRLIGNSSTFVTRPVSADGAPGDAPRRIAPPMRPAVDHMHREGIERRAGFRPDSPDSPEAGPPGRRRVIRNPLVPRDSRRSSGGVRPG